MRKIMIPILLTLVLTLPALADGKTGTTDKVVWEEAEADIAKHYRAAFPS